MEIQPFQLERYFAKHEFSARYLLSSSDCESVSMSDLLAMADDEITKLWQELKLGYTESLGHPLLKEGITELYKDINKANVLVVIPEEGIFLLMHALLESGDHVLCTFPGYQSLHEVARSIGCQVDYWQPDEEQDWHFNIDYLKSNLRPSTKLVVVNFPHNPTGYVPPQSDFNELINIIRDHGAYLLSDEMYQYLEVENGVTLPAACDLYERAISLFGMSKTFGLPGLRIGWLATRDKKVLNRVSQLKDYTTICNSAPSELLAIIALRSRTLIIQQQMERVHRNIEVLDKFFLDFREIFRWNRPKGGSICFPRMLTVENTHSFCEQLVEDTGIMLAPSKVFQFGEHHVRIGFGRENFPEAIEYFGKYIDRHLR